MNKNTVIAVLAIALILETGYLGFKHSAKPTRAPIGKPMVLSKGSNLMKSPLAHYAFELVPNRVNAQALTGWTIDDQKNTDGSQTVTLTPKDSSEQKQVYIIKKGDKLYFIEQTKMDDHAESDVDLNYRDDYGIITNSNGVIQ